VASGNAGSAGAMSSPACLTGVVAVGSTSLTDVVSGLQRLLGRARPAGARRADPVERPGGNKAATMTAPRRRRRTSPGGRRPALRPPERHPRQLVTALTSTGKPVTDARNGRSTPRLRVDAALASLTGPRRPGAGLPRRRPHRRRRPRRRRHPADPTVPASSSRLSGSDRFDTAAQVYGAAFRLR
jgi:hypothetical protein